MLLHREIHVFTLCENRQKRNTIGHIFHYNAWAKVPKGTKITNAQFNYVLLLNSIIYNNDPLIIRKLVCLHK